MVAAAAALLPAIRGKEEDCLRIAAETRASGRVVVAGPSIFEGNVGVKINNWRSRTFFS